MQSGPLTIELPSLDFKGETEDDLGLCTRFR